MGSWTLVIHGHGQHDNNDVKDADLQLQNFLQRLSDAGQTIDHSTITVGRGRVIEIDGDPSVAPEIREF
jgi:hypothetical protein